MDEKFISATDIVLGGSMAVYNDYAALHFIGIGFLVDSSVVWKVGSEDCLLLFVFVAANTM